MNRQRITASAMLLAAVAFSGCSSSGSSSSTSSSAPQQTADAPAPATQPSRPIPPDSPFAKVHEGEGSDEVFATIGQPTSMSSYITGKSFIPFHYGGDNSRMLAHYKGIGSITFSQNSAFSSGYSVMEIDYDPTDPGYSK
jgi:hypothetical protein